MTRRAQTSDAEAIGQLLHDFNAEYDEFTPGPEALGKRLRWLLARGDVTVVLAGEPPLGLALMRFRPSLWTDSLDCYLEELYVVRDRRGQGIGQALMETAMQVAREEGATRMDLGTEEDDTAARALYEKLGFELSLFYERELS
jgi:ribosomal protein S18 acetylase RimI-like enzyme